MSATTRPSAVTEASDDDDRVERRAFERGTVRQRKQRTVARATDRLAFEPPVAERTLVVSTPRLEHDVAALDAGDDEREPFGGCFAQLAVREVGGAEVGAVPTAHGHASQLTFRCWGARNSQPLNEGGRSRSERRLGSRSKRRCTAIRICTREK